eukprot:1141661-Pelagomonas_calceolata.AAC.1
MEGYQHWERKSPPQGLDLGLTSVSGRAQGGTICYIMQNPLSPSFQGPLVEAISVWVSGLGANLTP